MVLRHLEAHHNSKNLIQIQHHDGYKLPSIVCYHFLSFVRACMKVDIIELKRIQTWVFINTPNNRPWHDAHAITRTNQEKEIWAGDENPTLM